MDERVRFVARLLDDERMTTCPLTLRSDASRMPVPSRTSDTSRIQAQRSRPGIRSTRPGTTDDGGLCSPTTHHCASRGARRRHWPRGRSDALDPSHFAECKQIDGRYRAWTCQRHGSRQCVSREQSSEFAARAQSRTQLLPNPEVSHLAESEYTGRASGYLKG